MYQNQPSVENYRATAEQIRQLAQNMALPEARRDLLQLAKSYERLAAHLNERKAPTRQPSASIHVKAMRR